LIGLLKIPEPPILEKEKPRPAQIFTKAMFYIAAKEQHEDLSEWVSLRWLVPITISFFILILVLLGKVVAKL
jgi:hypothetical protein